MTYTELHHSKGHDAVRVRKRSCNAREFEVVANPRRKRSSSGATGMFAQAGATGTSTFGASFGRAFSNGAPLTGKVAAGVSVVIERDSRAPMCFKVGAKWGRNLD